MIAFINREKELGLLDEAWNSGKAELIIITGRKRVGKTSIIREFLREKKGIFHTVEDKQSFYQIKDLFDDLTEGKTTGIPGEWRDLFVFLPEALPDKERFYLVIDEFSNLIKNDKWVVLNFQKFWDNFAVNSKLFIVLTGSATGLMDRNTIAPDSLLYGRTTGVINVDSMNFSNTLAFYGDIQFQDKLKIYSGTGGIVEYIKNAGEKGQPVDTRENKIVVEGDFFEEEVRELLNHELGSDREIRSILNAIALGYNSIAKISKHFKLESRKILPRVNELVHKGFIERIKHVSGEDKTSSYYIKDVLVDYWLNKLHAGENTKNDQTIRLYFQKRFRIFIREEIAALAFNCGNIGSWWGKKDIKIDVLGIDSEKGVMHIGECTWEEKVDGEGMLKNLKKKTKKSAILDQRNDEKYYLFVMSFNNKPAGCECYDLQDLYQRILG